MAIIPVSQSKKMFQTGPEVPPKGTFAATCVDIQDRYGVIRQMYQSEKTEKVDLTAFLFEFKDRSGKHYKIASKTFRVSNHEKSGLYAFLKAWTGRPPQEGFDCAELKGTMALITVGHVPSQKDPERPFANIVSISPVPDDMLATTPVPASAVQQQPALTGIAQDDGNWADDNE